MEDHEILYEINELDNLVIPNKIDTDVRWIIVPDDYNMVYDHVKIQGRSIGTIDEWVNSQRDDIRYCGLFINGVMVARAAVEKYSLDRWETADVRVNPEERKKGYAKQVAYFITKYIIENNKIATCRTLESNLAMTKVILSLGFKEAT